MEEVSIIMIFSLFVCFFFSSLPEFTVPSLLMEARTRGSGPAAFCWTLSPVSSLSCCDVTGGKR